MISIVAVSTKGESSYAVFRNFHAVEYCYWIIIITRDIEHGTRDRGPRLTQKFRFKLRESEEFIALKFFRIA